jgi:hypothetical protein
VAQVYVQYKKASDPGWTNAATYNDQSGYNAVSYGPITLSGLDSLTTYNVRIYISRNTNPTDTLTTSTTSFTTASGTPTVTTDAATNVSYGSAKLNGTVNPQALTVDVYFDYGTTSGNYTSHVGVGQYTGSTGQAVQYSLSGLASSTTYYYRCRVVYNTNQEVSGSEVSFTTSLEPSEARKRGQDMLAIQDFDRKYGVATKVFFTVPQDSGSDLNVFYSGAVVWSAGEVKRTQVTYNDTNAPTVSGPTNTNNVPVQVSGSLYSLILDAAELQCDELFITLTNSGTAVRDLMLRVRTRHQLGSADIDARQISNGTAVKLTGAGTGSGLIAAGGISDGATGTGADIVGLSDSNWMRFGRVTNADGTDNTHIYLGAAASGVTDYYNGCVVAIIKGGVALSQGQARIITAYNATTKIATVDAQWDDTPGNGAIWAIAPGSRPWGASPASTDLAHVPTNASSYGDFLQFLFQRFAYKITQDGSAQIWFDSTNTELFKRTVSDTGSLQTVEILTDY